MKYNFELDLNNDNSISLLLKNINPNTTILEFGPATGRMTKYLKEHLGCKVYIVEIDEVSAKIAVNFAENAVIGNIETYEWFEKYKDIVFDYIIFADVLEHLYFPEEVLRKTLSLLSHDGSVLISIPNIAHNSIVINLLNNRFEYTNTGLLDDTHIRFFTYESLLKMLDSCDLVAVKQMATYSEVGENEIGCTYKDISPNLVPFFITRPYGNIYQFVFVAQKKNNISKNIYLKNNIKPFVNILKYEQQEQIIDSDALIHPLKQYVDQITETSQKKDNKIREQEITINNLNIKIQAKDLLINNQSGHIELLLKQERILNSILNSKQWILLQKLKGIFNSLLPYNSKRRFLVKIGYKLVKYPREILKHLNIENLKKVCYLIRSEGINITGKKIINYINNIFISTEIPKQTFKIMESKGKYKKICFPQENDPLVTIVIPVYNQWQHTYSCLLSILAHTQDVSYEIIVVDDVSTDETQNIEQYVENITVIRNEVNKGFLFNCNNAAKYGQGEYILFLNNDTNVQKDWLNSLVNLIKKDKSIGMVGSKLVYPDGRLQEAGGIIWKDASGWNYGRLDDPDKPEYNYVKEVDYISGACIMVGTDLWKEIGGFDERYAPAYFEDSDLAFEVRKRGYRVVCQPASLVIHFEGVSNGTDVSSGIKKYQVKNREKFIEKWQGILEKEHFSNGQNVFWARDRSKDKKTILVIDHYVPLFDQDAGSRTVYSYLKLFVEMGLHVMFMGDNFYKHEPYTSELEQLGIEVLYGSWYRDNYKKWVKENGKYLNYLFLNRPHISIKYIDLLKKHTSAKLIYYGHDLHFLREMREYELTGEKTHLTASNYWKKIEYDIFDKADVVYYPSEFEVEVIKTEKKDMVSRAIPGYIFENFLPVPSIDFNKRHDLLFVGGFSHTPNVDGITWFVQNVFYQVAEKVPGIKMFIVGSKPPQLVQDLQSDNIIVTGYVSDEELINYYERCKIVVVPLRYGAGVKGKVVEAMYYSMPIVTTSIGAEGMPDVEDSLMIVNDAKDFVKLIIGLYPDTDRLQQLSIKVEEYVKIHFSKQNALNIISQDIIV